VTGKKIKAKKMGIFVSTLRHNSDKKNLTENKIQNNVRQYKIGEFSCDITKYDFWICGVLQVFPKKNLSLYRGVFNILKITTTTNNYIVCISFISKSAHSDPPIYIYMQKEDSLSFPTVLGSGGQGLSLLTVRLTSTHYWVSGYQNFCFAPTETIDRRVKKIRSPTCGMV
jgi:hypothetical protein